MSVASKPLVWLITGCSSGFGTSLARIALKNGHKVIATSRTPSKTPELVKEVEGLGGLWVALDVAGTPSSLKSVVDEGIKKFGHIDVLVNNAGIGILGAAEDFSREEVQSIMTTNFLGPLSLIQATLPHMRARHSGIIVNISSGSGIDPSPSMSVYAASKFALEGLSLGLSRELSPFGIRVLIVQPGAFTTNMMNAVTLTKKKLTEEYRDTSVGQFVGIFDKDPEERTFKAANDVDKGCQGIFEVVTGTGRGEGKEAHLKLVLSQDNAQRTLEQTEKILKAREAFKDVWENTGHDGGVMKALAPAK